MSTQFDPLRTTTPGLHRFWFRIRTVDQWYTIMRECREWFGPQWKSQGKVRRKLTASHTIVVPIWVWFDVPDPRFATWIATKMALETRGHDTRDLGK